MTEKCKYCLVLYWKVETNKYKCCRKGEIQLPPSTKYNIISEKSLKEDNDFESLIRYYNNSFSFATFNANVVHENKKAIYNLKIQGQICHTTPTTLLHEQSDKPSCSRLYIYDDDSAIQKRLNLFPQVHRDHLRILTFVFKDNPYAKKYKCLHQLSNIKNIPNYRMYFIRKNG